MQRIKPQVKAIADAHIKARETGIYDNPPVQTREDVIRELYAGKTFEEVIHQVEIRYASIGSILISGLGHSSQSYKTAIYKGFKKLLQ